MDCNDLLRRSPLVGLARPPLARRPAPVVVSAVATPWCLEEPSAMMHFSCDICSKDVTPGAGTRYVVKMEAFAATDPAELTAADLDADHVEEMAELLTEMEEAGLDASEEVPAAKKMRFDLCPMCYRKFLGDPLGRDSAAKFDFSEN